MIACHICGTQVTPLHRQNEKGVAGIFACEQHNTKPVDPDVHLIVSVFKQPTED